MASVFWNKHFVARLCNDLFSADSELELSFHNDHQLVRRVDKSMRVPEVGSPIHFFSIADLHDKDD